MGVVRFYACAGDPVLVALRLVHKALREPDPALWVTGDATALQALSRAVDELAAARGVRREPGASGKP